MKNRIIIKRLSHTCRINTGVFSGCPYYISDSGVDDLDVLIRFVAGHTDQVAGQGVDLDRCAHVEHEDLAAVCVRACLKDEADCLRNCHEIADDVRMGDGDWTACLDLLLEKRDDGSVASEYVSEADCHELSFCTLQCFCRLFVMYPSGCPSSG